MMAIVLSTVIAGQAATLAAGTFDGHVLANHAGCSLTGAGPGRTIVRPDGTYNTFVRAVANRESFTLANLTIDCRNRADLAAAFEVNAHIPLFTANNVEILGVRRGGYAVSQEGIFRGTGISYEGDGAGILHHDAATETTLRGWRQVGGQYVFANTSGVGIDLDGIDYTGSYAHTPTSEPVTAVSYDAFGVDVSSHVEEDRSSGDIIRYLSPVLEYDAETTLRSPLVRWRDRIEVTGVAWTWARPDGHADTWRAWGSWRPAPQPSGTAKVYRLVLGRMVAYVPGQNRLAFQTLTGGQLRPPAPRWRYIDGSTAPTPTLAAGSRLDIVRVGDPANNGTRDTDSGAVNIGDTSVGAKLTRSTFHGGASDQVTVGGVGSVVVGCYVGWGYDEGFTVRGGNGRVTVDRCHAAYQGRTGIHLNDGPSDLYSCYASGNGTINDGSGDYGASATGLVGCTLQVRDAGIRNLDGLFPPGVDATPGGFEWERSPGHSARAIGTRVRGSLRSVMRLR
jgi:hypothetical protein